VYFGYHKHDIRNWLESIGSLIHLEVLLEKCAKTTSKKKTCKHGHGHFLFTSKIKIKDGFKRA
jgi:hypothetical protein